MVSDAEVFHRELERIRLRAMLAVGRLRGDADDELGRLGHALATLEAELDHPDHGGRGRALAWRLGLDDDERALAWTAVAATADPHLLPHLQVLGGADARRGVTLWVHALIWELGEDRSRTLARRLAEPHPLIRDHVLAWSGEPGAGRTLFAPARTVTWLAGGEQLDDALLGAGALVGVPGEVALDARQQAAAAGLPDVLLGTPSPLVIVEGATGTGRRTAIAAAAARLGKPVVALDLCRLPHGLAALEAALVGLRREARLRDALPVVANLHELIGEDPASRDALRVLARVIDDVPGTFAATAGPQGVEVPVARPLIRVRWNTPDLATRRTIWVRALGDDAASLDGELDDLAYRYGLGAGGIARAVDSARLLAGTAPLAAAHVIEGVRSNIAEQLGALAVRTEVRQRWDDLVLAPDILDQITLLVARVRHAHRVLEDWGFSSKLPKGQGVAALFSGPPGTGKTMVAGLIARQLELELYQVDLSKVVSKWVGETEKQLAKIFEAAEAGHALLLFDEADSLFAKRTEVKSATDRYANLEVNYLLQRIESFGGVSILTTNLETSIDPALRRRLAATITFWPPEEAERERLWKVMLTSRAPVEGAIDPGELAATFDEMTGANIRNAVLSAAFLAASEDSPITQGHLERAARAEYASMGRVLGRK